MSTLLEALSDVVRACQVLPTLVTSGQPAERHFRALRQAGAALVLDLRDPMEPRPFDEPATVHELGMEYANIPLGTGTLEDFTAERILSVLRCAAQRPVFVHCSSGNRAGGALLLYLLLDLGLPEEEASVEAMRIGLRSAEFLNWAVEYARRQRGLPGGGEAEATAPVVADHGPTLLVTWAGRELFEGQRLGGLAAIMDASGAAAPSPFDVLVMSVAACASTDVVAILEKQRTPPDMLQVRLEATRSARSPRRLVSLSLRFDIAGQGITRPQAERAVELSITKYCGVRSSLAGDIPVTWSVALS